MNQQGIGLGLCITKEIIEQFGGIIILKSRYGLGSRFTFCFKIENNDMVSPGNDVFESKFDISHEIQKSDISFMMEEINEACELPASPGHKFYQSDVKIPIQKKILIADDEAFNILVIKGLMRVLGMKNIEERVDIAYNGEEIV